MQIVVIECEVCGQESETEDNSERFETKLCVECNDRMEPLIF